MKHIAKAIMEVMKAVKGMEKNSKVGSGQNSYNGTKDQDVKEVFNDALAANGLCILPISIEDEVKVDRWEETSQYGAKQKQSVFVSVKTKYLLLHESGESVELAGYGHGVDSQDKAAGKATTYALKNCLLYTFLTPVGKIDDTESTHSNDLAVAVAVPVQSPQPIVYKTDDEFKKIVAWVKKESLETNSRIEYTLKNAVLTDSQKNKLESLRLLFDGTEPLEPK
jgi:hypothetical protein